MKNVAIIGLGIGNSNYLHQKSLEYINKSECLIGAKRMIKDFEHLSKKIYECSNADKIYEYIMENDEYVNFGVLVSGDTGFYSLAKGLTELLKQCNSINLLNIPALSSIQYFSSKLNIPWDNIKYISAHGRNVNIVSNVIFNENIFMLTGGDLKPDNICKILESKGLGHLKVSVGENLSYDDERITEDRASNIAKMQFNSLAVMIVHNDRYISSDYSLRSIRDEEFVTGKAPMTKSEVRTVSVSKLNLKSNYTVYDIGAGTGSVSIEIALKLREGILYAIEKDEEAALLIEKNIEKFKTYNIEIIKDIAPNGLDKLPKPDAAFIGGSSGNMDEIINAMIRKNPYVNIVINTITLQSLNEAMSCMGKYKLEDVEIINVSVSKSKKVGRYDMMTGQNPIYIISGKGSGL